MDDQSNEWDDLLKSLKVPLSEQQRRKLTEAMIKVGFSKSSLEESVQLYWGEMEIPALKKNIQSKVLENIRYIELINDNEQCNSQLINNISDSMSTKIIIDYQQKQINQAVNKCRHSCPRMELNPSKKPRSEMDLDFKNKRRALIDQLKNDTLFQPSVNLISTTPDFKKSVISNQLVIDKSGLITQIFKSQYSAVLITCPRRWGKSYNLDLIHTFCEIELDKNGNELAEELKLNIHLFNRGAVDVNTKERKPMKVTEDKLIMKEHFGQYIVIRLDLKDVVGESYDQVLHNLSTCVNNEYGRFAFLLDSDKLNDRHKAIFNSIYNQKTPTENDLCSSLYNLCYLCHLHFHDSMSDDCQIVLLIDEYDTPTNHAFSEFDQNTIEKIRKFMKVFFGSAIKGMKQVKLAVLTGVLRLAKDASVSPLNNISEYDFYDGIYSNYYGFSLSDIRLILQLWSFGDTHGHLLKLWYNGYTMPHLNMTAIYNPWSVMKSLNECLLNPEKSPERFFKSYWVESGSINDMKCLLFNSSILVKLAGLLDRHINKMSFGLSELLSFQDMTRLYQLLKNPPSFDEEISTVEQNTLFSYLFYTGYFTVVSYNSDTSACVVQLPNLEIRKYIEGLLKTQIASYLAPESLYTTLNSCFQEYFRNDYNTQYAVESFTKSFTPAFHKFLQRLPTMEKLKLVVDPDQQTIHANESLVHCILVSIILFMAIDFKSFGSEYTGENRKRSDIIIIHKRVVMIIELKFEKTASVAIDQILEKGYHQEFEAEYDLMLVGLNINRNKAVSVEAKFYPKGSDKQNPLFTSSSEA